MNNDYFIGENFVHIFLNYKGHIMTTLIDVEDFEVVNGFPNTWYPKPSKYGFYAIGRYTENGKYKHIQMHRLVTNAPIGKEVDHSNHDTLNNCKSNLRVVDKATNQINRIRSNSQSKSKIRGVHKNKRGRYVAQIQINKNKYYLGAYNTPEEAEEAVNEFVISYVK